MIEFSCVCVVQCNKTKYYLLSILNAIEYLFFTCRYLIQNTHHTKYVQYSQDMQYAINIYQQYV
jgi:hypothetical protein